ncbi:MAG: hypothetical protein A3I05_00875 [Deltaproteobacteria bacterium RIFCSPLOWO2_02_FULL_44_10]|nr:MAG: hypothetical protein A3C46_06550 [Deltaproteobacteria bacterium RIFCSPHIGHO2_02_FULL_44_16]OGQ45309.1 MAG: hypothetical protein A3I05_00875 [Deltaproteobacteria bacterium RIFCSPLOWO2_02_FULL_44_10]
MKLHEERNDFETDEIRVTSECVPGGLPRGSWGSAGTPQTAGPVTAKRFEIISLFFVVFFFISSCVGEDKPLRYFPSTDVAEKKEPLPGEKVKGRKCNVTFTSKLCVTLKGDHFEAGTEKEGPICTEVPPFPLRITGATVTIQGDEFPDIAVEGKALPVPIIINGKGDGTGEENKGEGTIDAVGNIVIQDFSLFINIIGSSAEVPGLTLTTGTTPELKYLPSLAGSPPDSTGAMRLVTATTLPHLFDATDDLLLDASLTASFEGSIKPTLEECGDSGLPRSLEVNKIQLNESGHESASPIPEGKYLEVSNGTYIAQNEQDVGAKFETAALFRIKNISSQTLDIDLPSKIGAFALDARDPLTRQLSPQQSFLLSITFHPHVNDVQPGKVMESMIIGNDAFQLVAAALNPQGKPSLDALSEEGEILQSRIEKIDLGEMTVTTSSEKRFFQCTLIKCEETETFTNCKPCEDATSKQCQLLPVSVEGNPLGEVTSTCEARYPNATPLLTIDLKGTSEMKIVAGKQVLALRNNGVTPLTIESITLEDIQHSQSKGEFSLPVQGVFVASNIRDIQQKIENALNGKEAQPQQLPFTLPPFSSEKKNASAFVVVAYHPHDLRGSDGSSAGIGSAAIDRALITVITDVGKIEARVSGKTTIQEIPELELFVKTTKRLRQIAHGENFPFRDITAETKDQVVPLFLKLSETATQPLRIVSINIEGEDASKFELLDTPEKIKGGNCSTDLSPVSRGATGFDLLPGAHSKENLPLFGCLHFHREPTDEKRVSKATLTVSALQLSETRKPLRNPDGSFKETKFTIDLMAAVNPLQGMVVVRITQAMAIILHPQVSGVSSADKHSYFIQELKKGNATESDTQLFIAAVLLDPFDDDTYPMTDSNEPATIPGDGVTAVLRKVATHIRSEKYEDPLLYDYSGFLHDETKPEGKQGIFEGYPNIPAGFQSNGFRMFTTSLSYPGPLTSKAGPPWPSHCVTINPCSNEEMKLLSDIGVPPGGKGACAFFFGSAGRYDSPEFHTPTELPGGIRRHFCDAVNQEPALIDGNTGIYTLDGHITFEELGFRLFGPTYFHNPYGPFEKVRPLDAVSLTAVTTHTIKPQESPQDPNVLPNEAIDHAREMYKINLTDSAHVNPPLCEGTVKNKTINGKVLSTWRYLAPLLSKDPEGKIPAGCPQDDPKISGGTAFLHGRPVDHETGVVTFVTAMHFGSSNDLTFAFKEVPIFIILNGWVCNPNGDPENFEGERCYDMMQNERDEVGQISILE